MIDLLKVSAAASIELDNFVWFELHSIVLIHALISQFTILFYLIGIDNKILTSYGSRDIPHQAKQSKDKMTL